MIKYIGADVHSASCYFIVLDAQGKLMDRCQIQTSKGNLLTYLRSISGKKMMTFEEGRLSRWLYGLLVHEVDQLIVCNPMANTFAKQGPKTDFRDATHLAMLSMPSVESWPPWCWPYGKKEKNTTITTSPKK